MFFCCCGMSCEANGGWKCFQLVARKQQITSFSELFPLVFCLGLFLLFRNSPTYFCCLSRYGGCNRPTLGTFWFLFFLHTFPHSMLRVRSERITLVLTANGMLEKNIKANKRWIKMTNCGTALHVVKLFLISNFRASIAVLLPHQLSPPAATFRCKILAT